MFPLSLLILPFILVLGTFIADLRTAGIGAAIALALAQAGADLILAQRDIAHTTTRDTIRGLPGGKAKAEIIQCDLTDLENVKSVFDRALKVAEGGEVHILVNNAGMLMRQDSVDIGLDDWNQVRGFLRILSNPFDNLIWKSFLVAALCPCWKYSADILLARF